MDFLICIVFQQQNIGILKIKNILFLRKFFKVTLLNLERYLTHIDNFIFLKTKNRTCHITNIDYTQLVDTNLNTFLIG